MMRRSTSTSRSTTAPRPGPSLRRRTSPACTPCAGLSSGPARAAVADLAPDPPGRCGRRTAGHRRPDLCVADVAPGARPTISMANIAAQFLRTPWARREGSSQPCRQHDARQPRDLLPGRLDDNRVEPGEIDPRDPPWGPRRIRPRLVGFSYVFGRFGSVPDLRRGHVPRRRRHPHLHRGRGVRRPRGDDVRRRLTASTGAPGTRSPAPSPCPARPPPSPSRRRAGSSSNGDLRRRACPASRTSLLRDAEQWRTAGPTRVRRESRRAPRSRASLDRPVGIATTPSGAATASPSSSMPAAQQPASKTALR